METFKKKMLLEINCIEPGYAQSRPGPLLTEIKTQVFFRNFWLFCCWLFKHFSPLLLEAFCFFRAEIAPPKISPNYFVIFGSRRKPKSGEKVKESSKADDDDDSELFPISSSTLIEIGFFYWLIDFQMINQKNHFFFLFSFMIIRHE